MPVFAPIDSPVPGIVVALVLVGLREAEAADEGVCDGAVCDEAAVAGFCDEVVTGTDDVVDIVALPLFIPTIANANTKEVSVKVVGWVLLGPLELTTTPGVTVDMHPKA